MGLPIFLYPIYVLYHYAYKFKITNENPIRKKSLRFSLPLQKRQTMFRFMLSRKPGTSSEVPFSFQMGNCSSISALAVRLKNVKM